MNKHEKTAIAPSAPDAEGVRQETLHTLTTTCPPDRDLPDPASLSLEELAPIVIEGVRKLRLYDKDPKMMIVPMLTLEQARTFRVGGKMPQGYYQIPQKNRKVERHQPAEET